MFEKNGRGFIVTIDFPSKISLHKILHITNLAQTHKSKIFVFKSFSNHYSNHCSIENCILNYELTFQRIFVFNSAQKSVSKLNYSTI